MSDALSEQNPGSGLDSSNAMDACSPGPAASPDDPFGHHGQSVPQGTLT